MLSTLLRVCVVVALGSSCARNSPSAPGPQNVDQVFNGTIGPARGCSPFSPFIPPQDPSNSCVPYGPYTALTGGSVTATLTWGDDQTALEVYMVDSNGMFLAASGSNAFNTITTKTFTQTITTGTTYRILVNYHSSRRRPMPTVSYQIRIVRPSS